VNLPVTVRGVGPSARPHLAVTASDYAVSTAGFALRGAFKMVIRLTVANPITRDAQVAPVLPYS